MTIVSAAPTSMPLLEVAVLHARDADAAARGEADRLLLVADPLGGGRSPEPNVVSAVVRETDLPVRVLLRPAAAGEGPVDLARYVDLARTCLELGASGFSFGFLDRDLDVDRLTCAALAAELPGTPWTFDRTFDHALVTDRAWRDVLTLPGLDGVRTAGSMRGLVSGSDELVARATADDRVAALVVAEGGLSGEFVPWLLRAGITQFALGEEARPGRSWAKAYVDAAAVRSWRLLLDDAHHRALGVPVD